MPMLNGAAAPEPSTPPEHSSEMNGNNDVIVNFKAGWKQLGAALFFMVSTITTAATAGWIVLPAKQSDMASVQMTLVQVSKDLKTTQESMNAMSQAVGELTKVVKTLQQTSGRVKAR